MLNKFGLTRQLYYVSVLLSIPLGMMAMRDNPVFQSEGFDKNSRGSNFEYSDFNNHNQFDFKLGQRHHSRLSQEDIHKLHVIQAHQTYAHSFLTHQNSLFNVAQQQRFAEQSSLSYYALQVSTASFMHTLGSLKQECSEIEKKLFERTGLLFTANKDAVDQLSIEDQLFFYEHLHKIQILHLKINSFDALVNHNKKLLAEFEQGIKQHVEQYSKVVAEKSTAELLHEEVFLLKKLIERRRAEINRLKNFLVNEQATYDNIKQQQDLFKGNLSDRIGAQFRALTDSKKDQASLENDLQQVTKRIARFKETIARIENQIAKIEAQFELVTKIIDGRVQEYSGNAKQLQTWLYLCLETGDLDEQDQALLSVINTYLSHEAEVHHGLHNKFSDNAKKMLETLNVAQTMYTAEVTGNILQQHLCNQIADLLNYQADVMFNCRDLNLVKDYHELALASSIHALESIHSDLPQQAIIAVDLAVRCNDALSLKMVAQGFADVTFGLARGSIKGFVQAFTAPVDALLHFNEIARNVTKMGGSFVRLLRGNPATVSKLSLLVQNFVELPVEKQAEEISSLIVSFYTNPTAVTKKITDLNKTLSILNKLLEAEAKIQHCTYSIEAPLSTVTKGLKVPEKYAKQVDSLVKMGRITTQQEAIAYVQRIETPLLTTFKETIVGTNAENITKAAEKNCAKMREIAETERKLIGFEQEVAQIHSEFSMAVVTEKLRRGVSTVILPKHLFLAVNEIDKSVGNIEKLRNAVMHFMSKPGALGKDGPITKLIQCGTDSTKLGTARGAAFELEKAYDLSQQGKKVLGFGQKFQSGTAAWEFDIICEHALVECKNINWTMTDISDFQSKIGSRVNVAKNIGKNFELYSKQAIPDHVKKWLGQKNISFFEG